MNKLTFYCITCGFESTNIMNHNSLGHELWLYSIDGLQDHGPLKYTFDSHKWFSCPSPHYYYMNVGKHWIGA